MGRRSAHHAPNPTAVIPATRSVGRNPGDRRAHFSYRVLQAAAGVCGLQRCSTSHSPPHRRHSDHAERVPEPRGKHANLWVSSHQRMLEVSACGQSSATSGARWFHEIQIGFQTDKKSFSFSPLPKAGVPSKGKRGAPGRRNAAMGFSKRLASSISALT